LAKNLKSVILQFENLKKYKNMEIVRTIMRSDLLKPVINLPWANKDLEVEVIVIPRLKETNKKQDVTFNKLKGCLKEYANPAMWEMEQYAWQKNVIEKFGTKKM